MADGAGAVHPAVAGMGWEISWMPKILPGFSMGLLLRGDCHPAGSGCLGESPRSRIKRWHHPMPPPMIFQVEKATQSGGWSLYLPSQGRDLGAGHGPAATTSHTRMQQDARTPRSSPPVAELRVWVLPAAFDVPGGARTHVNTCMSPPPKGTCLSDTAAPSPPARTSSNTEKKNQQATLKGSSTERVA